MTVETWDPNNKATNVSLGYRTTGTTAPTRVQSAYSRYTSASSGSTTVTLGSTPTTGNMLVALIVGYGTILAQSGWTMVYSDNASSQFFQYGGVFTRVVQSGDPAAWTFSLNNGPNNVAVFEFSGCIDASGYSGAATAVGSTIAATPSYDGNTYQVLALESDSIATYSSVSGSATLLWDGSGGGVNHTAAIFHMTGSGTVTATFSTTLNYPFYVGFWAIGTGAGANLKVNINGAGSTSSTRVLTSPLSYFEISSTTVTGTMSLGLTSRYYNISTSNLIGYDYNGIGFNSSGAVKLNNSTLATIQTYTSGAVVGVAVDLLHQLIWFTTNGTSWNNDILANQNPVGAVGGISIAGISPQSALFPAVGGSASGAASYANFSTSMFSYTPPTGFVSPDSTGVSAVWAQQDGPQHSAWPSEGRVQPVAIPTYQAVRSSDAYADRPSSTTISGTVKEGSTLVGGKTVMAFQTGTGVLVGTAKSAPTTGAYSIPTGGINNVFAVGFDPTTYQAEVDDNVTPG